MKVPLRNLSIEAYRGIANLALEALAPVNLVVGANDTGKSSILEAAALALRPTDHSQWVSAVRRRDADAALAEGIWSMFPGARAFPADARPQHSSPIRLVAQLDEQPTQIEAKATAFPVPDLEAAGSLAIDVRLAIGEHDTARLVFPTAKPIPSYAGTRVVTVIPASHTSSHAFVEELSQVIDTGRKQLALALLQVFDEHAKDLCISAASGHRAVRVMHELRGVCDLSSFGAGMRRAATLALALSRATPGVLLVDDLEAGIHPSLLRRVLGQLLEAAALAEVQLLATTNSLEAIDACVGFAADRGAEATLVAFWLQRKDGRHEVRRYDHARLRQLREGGLDIR